MVTNFRRNCKAHFSHSVVISAATIYIFGGNQNGKWSSQIYSGSSKGWNLAGNLGHARVGHRTIKTALNTWFHIGGVGRLPIERCTNEFNKDESKFSLDNYAWYPEIFTVTTADFLTCI